MIHSLYSLYLHAVSLSLTPSHWQFLFILLLTDLRLGSSGWSTAESLVKAALYAGRKEQRCVHLLTLLDWHTFWPRQLSFPGLRPELNDSSVTKLARFVANAGELEEIAQDTATSRMPCFAMKPTKSSPKLKQDQHVRTASLYLQRLLYDSPEILLSRTVLQTSPLLLRRRLNARQLLYEASLVH